jgi:hypothetical protein
MGGWMVDQDPCAIDDAGDADAGSDGASDGQVDAPLD